MTGDKSNRLDSRKKSSVKEFIGIFIAIYVNDLLLCPVTDLGVGDGEVGKSVIQANHAYYSCGFLYYCHLIRGG